MFILIKLFITFMDYAIDYPLFPFFVSSNGGKTWQKWGDENISSSSVSMSADGSKIFATSQVTYPDFKPVYRLAILPRPQPVTPGGTGTGTGETTTPSTPTTPSTGSASSGASVTTSSSTSSKKPEKSSSNLAETGVSVWAVGGLAVVAIAVGGLALRKRL